MSSFSLQSAPFISSLRLGSKKIKRSLNWLCALAKQAYGDAWVDVCPDLVAAEELLYAIGYSAVLTDDGEALADPDADENQHITIVGEAAEGIIFPTAMYGPSIGLIDGEIHIAFGGFVAPLRVANNPYHFHVGIASGVFTVTTRERDDKTKVSYLEAEITTPANEYSPELTITVNCNLKKVDGQYIKLGAKDAGSVMLEPSKFLGGIGGGGEYATVGQYDAKTGIRTPYIKDGVAQYRDGVPTMTAIKLRDFLFSKGRDSMVITVKGLSVSQGKNETKGNLYWKVHAHLASNEIVELNSNARENIVGIVKSGAGTGNDIDWDGVRDALNARRSFPFDVVISKHPNGVTSNIVGIGVDDAPKNAISSGRASGRSALKPAATQAQLPSAVMTVDIPATTATVDQTLAAANVEVAW